MPFVIRLRLVAGGETEEIVLARDSVVIGSGPGADVRREGLGWAARHAVLTRIGDELLVADAAGHIAGSLRTGDALELGGVSLTWLGHGPTTTAAATAPAPAPTPAGAPASAPLAAPSPPRVIPAGQALRASQRWRSGTFGDELVGALRRSPWFVLSAAVHGVALLLLVMFGPIARRETSPIAPYGIVSATAVATDPLESGGPEDRGVDGEPEEVSAPEFDPGPPVLEEKHPEEMPSPGADLRETTPAPEADLLSDPVDDASVPEPLISPSPTIVRLRKPRTEKPPAPPPPAPPTSVTATADDFVDHDQGQALERTRRAVARLRGELRGGGSLGRVLRGLRTADLLVVSGQYDHMETVLEELHLPYTLRSPYDLVSDPDLSAHKLVFWNCGAMSIPPSYRVPLVEMIQRFVRDGGWLFTTDWEVGSLLVKAFPGYLSTGGALRPLPSMVVSIRPVTDAEDDPLLEGVFEPGTNPKWWLEPASQDVIVANRSKVKALIESPDLAGAPYLRSPVVVATFPYERGRVLHAMGHYYQQEGNVTGTAGVQRLALNFVRMRLERGAGAVATERPR